MVTMRSFYFCFLPEVFYAWSTYEQNDLLKQNLQCWGVNDAHFAVEEKERED